MNNQVLSHFDDYCCTFRLIKSALNGIGADISDLNINWKHIFDISENMSVTALVKSGIDFLPDNQNKPENDIYILFKNEFRRQAVMDSNQMYELKLMQKEFEKAETDMLVMKGCFFKKIYSSSVLRYMGDIDTYVRFSDFKNADKILEKLGYQSSKMGGHDKIFAKPPFICLEQHFTLYDGKNPAIKDYYANILDRCTLKNGFSHIYEMTPEDTYIYLSVHAVHHFNYAGIAPRIFIDYYVFREKFGNNLDWDYVYKKLNDFGYLEFDKKAVEIAYCWFGKDGNGLDKSSDLQLFLASCSTYGTMEHNVGIRASKMTKTGKKPSKIKFFLKQLFPDFDNMKAQNPILRKFPLLLPFVWIIYIFRRAFSSSTRHYYGNINKASSDFYAGMIRELGLDNQKD